MECHPCPLESTEQRLQQHTKRSLCNSQFHDGMDQYTSLNIGSIRFQGHQTGVGAWIGVSNQGGITVVMQGWGNQHFISQAGIAFVAVDVLKLKIFCQTCM